MSNVENNAKRTVISWPLTSILTIVFVVLKLTSVIDWSWWWVLSPLWISALFVVAVFILIFIIAFIKFLKYFVSFCFFHRINK